MLYEIPPMEDLWKVIEPLTLNIIDWNGHFKSDPTSYWFHPRFLTGELVQRAMFRVGLHGPQCLEGPMDFGVFTQSFKCPYCQQGMTIKSDGKGLYFEGEPCLYPDGLVVEFDIPIPSGKIAVANDLRDWFPIEKYVDWDIPKIIRSYASVGLAHGYVSNSNPRIYKKGDLYTISPMFDDNVVPPHGKEVASVSTALWWYSICDYEELERRFEKLPPEDPYRYACTPQVIDTEPGIYHFKHDLTVQFEEPGVIQATFQRV